ncbi:MAG: hypothetical protein E7475_08520, partial [Ruminococcaceae bacterium]|nr:hypothetical protein [Oscillospiraceae bacterium]
VNVSVRTLDFVIVACVLVIILFVALSLSDPGLTVSFDAKGGTDVPSQSQEYGQPLELPAPPTREGYRFTGWYTDYACFEPWDQENDLVEGELTLYAGWEPVADSSQEP